MSKKLFWRTERRKVKDLVRYDKNPRTLSPSQMEGLQRSLKKFNLAELPAINTDGTLVAGNQRVLALLLSGRGEEEIEVRVPNRRLTDKEFRDYLLTSNRSGGDWDWEKLAAEFGLEELITAGFESGDLTHIFDDNLEVADDDFDPDKEAASIKNPQTKPGDMYRLGRHALICGDATDPEAVKRLMSGAKADMFYCDFPFNINLSYEKGVGGTKNYGGTMDDGKTDEEYREFLRKCLVNAKASLKEDAHVFSYCDQSYIWLLQTLYRELDVKNRRVCLWLKNIANPVPGVAFSKVYEPAVYGTIGRPYLAPGVRNLDEVLNKEVASGNRLIDDVLDLLEIWLVKREASSDYEHPTQKPPQLHEKALRRCTRPGGIVLDLCAGSGSLMSACEQLKRTAYMAEVEPVFCDVIINRFKKISDEKIVKVD